jgi:transglutaminase-like putative cysteine protease
MFNRNVLLKLITVFCIPLFFIVKSAAQEALPLGQVSTEEIQLKECSFDKSADAVILLDEAKANFDADYKLVTERRIRLKILKEKGIERGNIQIPYYSADDFEYISDIDAVVVNPTASGSVTVSQLERKNIFTRKINSLYSLVSFALPTIKVGSIIDYKYRSTMKSYAGLRRWEFQTEIPVLTSSYELAPLPNSEFAYSVYKVPEFPIDIKLDKANGKVHFVMTNVPGLRDEVFTASKRNFLQRVNFQFASYTNYYGKHNYTTTWKQLSDELLDEHSFGSQVGKDLSGTPFLKSLSPFLSPLEKMKTIYDYVRSNIAWNDITSKFSEDGVKSILEKKKGNSGDINLLLISLLKSAGLETYPLLVSERDNGLIDTTYSYLDQFNKVVAYVNVNGNQYVLDGTDANTPFFMVPTDLLNTIGFVVDRKKQRFVYFNNLPNRQQELVSLAGVVQEDGSIKGGAVVTNTGYAKLEKESRFKSDKIRYQDALLKPHPFILLDSFAVTGLKDDSAALQEEVKFHYNLKQAGGYYLLSANLFTGLSENPFITQYRFTDIDFGSKYRGSVVAHFALPSAFTTETLPPNKKLVSPDRSMSITRTIEKGDNEIGINYLIEINREKYLAEEYEMVKAFFGEMINLLNEPVLLKSK